MINMNGMEVRGGTFCLSKAGLAEGTNDSTIKIAAPNGAGVDYVINGILYHKADADNIDPTVCDAQAAGTTCLYLFTLNTAGVLDTIKGVEVSTAALTAGTAVLHWPAPAANTCPIGALKIVAGTVAWTVGTDDITTDAGTATFTFYDLFAVPTAPLTA